MGRAPTFMLAFGEDIGRSNGDWLKLIRLVGKPCSVLFEKECCKFYGVFDR